jgi:signal transduction histidine kinase
MVHSAPELISADKIRRSGRSLQYAIILFCFAIVAITSTLVAGLMKAQRGEAMDHARIEAANLSAAFEEQVNQLATAVSTEMSRLKSSVDARGLEAGFQDWVQRNEAASIIARMTVIGVDGKVVASNVEPGFKVKDLSDREHFKVHAANQHRGLFIGVPILGRGSGKLIIPLSLRLENPDGEFAGVILASIYSDFLTGLSHNVHLGQYGSLMMLGTEDGVVRAHYSPSAGNNASLIGARLPHLQALRDSNFDAEGSYEAADESDNIERLYQWEKVRSYPLLIVVGLAKSEMLAAANRQETLLLAACAFTLPLVLLLPYLLSREISKRTAHEIALNNEQDKLRHANDALAEERRNLRAINEELLVAKRRAEEANSAKSTFLMNMSHEFRTPMHAILNYTSMCLATIEGEDNENLRKYMENTRSAGFRLLGLLNALLDLTKLEEGKIELKLGKADLRDVVKKTVSELGSLLEEKQMQADIQVTCLDTTAVFDEPRLVQVLVNLFSNAVKFSPAESVIEVSVSDAALYGRPALQCTVSDRGAGIPEAELDKVFDRFIQSSLTGTVGGAGLGLTICREIIELHSGKIWAANREGGGASMSFIIPRERPSKTGDETSPSAGNDNTALGALAPL